MNQIKTALVFVIGAAAWADFAQAAGTEFTYQGQLKQSGLPVDAQVDFEFTLWNDAADPDLLHMIGGPALLGGVEVVRGLFSVTLDFGEEIIAEQPLWLEIAVRVPAWDGIGPEPPFTILEPREALTAAPFSINTRGIVVTSSGNAGLGTLAPEGRLDVRTPEPVPAIRAESALGASLFGTITGINETPDGNAVVGIANNGQAWAVWGESRDGVGIVGRTVNGRAAQFYGPAEFNSVLGPKISLWGGIDSNYYGLGIQSGQLQIHTDNSLANIIFGYGASGSLTELMRLTGGGNLGIGTASPENTLHVHKGSAGAAAAGHPNAPLLVENSTNVYLNLLSPDANERGILFGDPSSNVSGGIVYNATGTPDGLQFRTHPNTTRAVITSGGNAGIGELNPLVRTHIEGTNLPLDAASLLNEDLVVEDPDAVLGLYSSPNGSFGSAIALGEIGASSVLADKWAMYRTTSGAESRLSFSYGLAANYATNQNVLTLRPNGLVGIGTTAPARMLEISGSGSLARARITNTSSFGPHLEFRGPPASVGSSFTVGSIDFLDSLDFRLGGIAYLRNETLGDILVLSVGGADHAWIHADGRVGLGTNAPSARLHIAGTGALNGIRAETATAHYTRLTLKTLNNEFHLQTEDAAGDWFGVYQEGGTSPGWKLVVEKNTGQVGMGTPAPAHPLHVGTNSTNGNGAHCTNGGVWTNGSDRKSKEKFEAINPLEVLEKVARLPITKWKYKGEDDTIRHIGPVAQDFHAAFALGGSDRHIGTIDADGVALAAIQGLRIKLDEKEKQIQAQEQTIRLLQQRLARLEQLITPMAADRIEP